MKCVYPSTQPPNDLMETGPSPKQRRSPRPIELPWSAPVPSDMFPIPRHRIQAHSGLDDDPKNDHAARFPSDTYLCQYYLYYLYPEFNISRCEPTSTSGPLQMPIPELPSEAVYQSLLAVSAVRLAWDMVSRSPCPKASTVCQVLLCGYQHLNQATYRMRTALSQSDNTELDSLIASTLILMPFAAASQQINHWISSKSLTGLSNVKLSSTPRDMITFVRGVRAMLEVLSPALPAMGYNTLIDIDRGLDHATTALVDSHKSSSNEILLMSRITIDGSRQALVRLEVRLRSLCFESNDPTSLKISACRVAFEILEQIRNSVESVLNSCRPEYLSSSIASPTQSPPWLEYFIHLPCELRGTILLPHDPITRLLLSFYAQVPQQYLDLILPLLDERLEQPVDAFSDGLELDLTRTQAFALDIYAHWSVLMSIVEENSWWIGRLPVTTLDGLVNRYGLGFVKRLWPECGEQEEWWPGEMLPILRDNKRTGSKHSHM